MAEGRLHKHALYSDMDKTLIGDDKQISEKNIEALRRFTAAGGHFSVASGRNVQITRPFLRSLPVNAPAILYNGAAVYDFAEERFLHEEHIDPVLAADILRLSLEIYPGGCPQTFHAGDILLYNRDGIMDHYIENERQPFAFAPLTDRCERAMKAMVYGEHDQLERVRLAVIDRFGEDAFHCTYSAPFYLEFLPRGVTKGSALRWIEENVPGFAREDVAAIGDFDNDFAILRAASLGAAVDNAPDRVKAAADITVGDNNHSAVAELIDRYLFAQT